MPGQLAASIRAKYPGAYDDLDDAALEQQVLLKYPQYADLVEPEPVAPATPAEPKRSLTDTAVDALPMIGGALGGLVGGAGGTVGGFGVGGVPGAVGGATVGGAGGEGIRQAINALRGKGALLTPGAAAKGIATQGAVQGGTEALGAGVGRLLTGTAKALYRGALRPSAAIRAKTPDVVERGLADRIVVGPKGARDKALEGVRASKAEADALVAGQQGAPPITRQEASLGLKPEMDANARRIRAGLPDQGKAILKREQSLPQSATVQEAHEIARTLNDVADPAFRAANRGGAPASIKDRMNRALAQTYSGAVKDRVPGLAEVNKTTMDRMGLARALNAAAERPHVLANIAASGAGAGEFFRSGGDPGNALTAALAIKGVSSPRSMSATALGMNSLGQHPAAIANSVRAALLAMMSGDEQGPE